MATSQEVKKRKMNEKRKVKSNGIIALTTQTDFAQAFEVFLRDSVNEGEIFMTLDLVNGKQEKVTYRKINGKAVKVS